MVTLDVPLLSSYGHLKFTEFVFIISLANLVHVYAGQPGEHFYYLVTFCFQHLTC